MVTRIGRKFLVPIFYLQENIFLHTVAFDLLLKKLAIEVIDFRSFLTYIWGGIYKHESINTNTTDNRLSNICPNNYKYATRRLSS